MLYAAGVDIGGSHISAGVVGEDGRLLCKRTVPLEGARDASAVAALAADLVAGCAREVSRLGGSLGCGRPIHLAGVGVGVPGLVRQPEGVVALAPNLGWRDVDAGGVFRERFGAIAGNVRIDNDANLAAMGEYVLGAARDCDVAVCVTLGTGIGAGIVIAGEIYHGASGFAGEIGHMKMEDGGEPCGCGGSGCLETVASGTAIARRGSMAMGRDVTARQVLDAAMSGDEAALAVVNGAGGSLGAALSTLAGVLDPSVIVLGGAVSLAGETILRPVVEAMDRLILVRTRPRLATAELGPDAAIIGGAVLFLARDP